jgi:hypothetical protein
MAKNIEIMAEIDQLNTKFNHHEYQCEKNNEEIKFRLRRVEMILWTTSGTSIVFLATLLTSVLFNQ